MIYNYKEVDKRIQKILNVLSTLGLSFEMFSEKRIQIIDNNVTFAEKRNIGLITAIGNKVSLKLYGYRKRNTVKAKMKTNEVVFGPNVSLTDVGSKTRALFKALRTAEHNIFVESMIPTISTKYFVNEADITGIDYLTEYTINEAVSCREATYDEVYAAYRHAVEMEVDRYYPQYANNPARRKQMIDLWTNGALRAVWNKKFHAYTTDGTDLLFAITMPDDSTYVAMAYVPPEKRGQAASISVFKKLLDESPNGLSLHTNPSNRVVIGLAKHFGLQQYPSNNPNEVYYATQDGLDGANFMQ